MSDSSRLTISTDAGVHRLRPALTLRLVVGEARQDWHAGVRDGAGCPAALPRPGRDCRSRDDRWRLPAAPADTTRAVRDGQRRTRCRCRPACGRGVRTARAARFRSVRNCRHGRPLAAFQRRGQRGDALLEHGEGIAVVVGAGKLVDLGRQRLHVVGQAAPARRWRRHWRRSSEAPRSRLRAGAPSTGSSLVRRIRSSLAPRLRIASS